MHRLVTFRKLFYIIVSILRHLHHIVRRFSLFPRGLAADCGASRRLADNEQAPRVDERGGAQDGRANVVVVADMDLPSSSSRASSSKESIFSFSYIKQLGRLREWGGAIRQPGETSKVPREEADDTHFVVGDCNICCGVEEIPTRPITETCAHARETCSACVSKYISLALDGAASAASGIHFEITCPHVDCGEALQYQDVAFHAERVDFETYDTVLSRMALEGLEDFRFCTAPGCRSGQLHVDGDAAPAITCHDCGARSCFTCRVPWHPGVTCEDVQNEITDEADAAADLTDMLRRCEIRQCPKCRHGIERVSGCDAMRCRCGTTFCWRCAARYEGKDGIFSIGNEAHSSSCPHHRSSAA